MEDYYEEVAVILAGNYPSPDGNLIADDIVAPLVGESVMYVTVSGYTKHSA